MNEEEKQNLTSSARGLARWFSVDVTIKMFGHIIWEYHFPPQNS